MNISASNQASYQCADYLSQVEAWQIVNDCYGGTLVMRKKAVKYLPKFPAELLKAYNIRKNQAVFYNATKRTHTALVGMVFRQNPKLSDKMPQKLKDATANIDLMGSHLDIFSKELFGKAILDGHAFILIEYPKKIEATPSSSALDDIGRRPYWLIIPKNRVINYRSRNDNGRLTLTQATILEEEYVADGTFGEKLEIRYRVLSLIDDPLAVGKYKVIGCVHTKDGGGQIKAGEPYEVVTVKNEPLRRIPLIPVYSNRTGFLSSEPPLIDLALLNIAHFQDFSDYRKAKHVSGIAIPYAKDRDVSKKQHEIAIGTDTLIDLGKQGELGFAEVTGAALSAQRDGLNDLRSDMASLALSVIAPKSEVNNPETATGRLLDTAAESSELASWARNLEDAVENAFDVHADLEGEAIPDMDENERVYQANDDFVRFILDANILRELNNMAMNDNLPLEELWAIMERAGLLTAGFDIKTALKNLEKQIEARTPKPPVNPLPNTKDPSGANPEDKQLPEAA